MKTNWFRYQRLLRVIIFLVCSWELRPWSILCRGASAAIVVYDITRPETLTRARSWIVELQVRKSLQTTTLTLQQKMGPENVILVLAGNKSDRIEERKVESDHGKSLADEFGAFFIETSRPGHSWCPLCWHRVAGARDNLNISQVSCLNFPLPPPAPYQIRLIRTWPWGEVAHTKANYFFSLSNLFKTVSSATEKTPRMIPLFFCDHQNFGRGAESESGLGGWKRAKGVVDATEAIFDRWLAASSNKMMRAGLYVCVPHRYSTR